MFLVVAALAFATQAPVYARHCDGFASCLERLADIDGDGCEDFAVGDPNPDMTTEHGGGVWLVSGRTQTLIRRIEPPAPDRWFGHTLAYLAQSKRDPHGLLVVGSLTSFGEHSLDEGLNARDAGRVYVFRTDGTLVQQLANPNTRKGSHFGTFLRAAGDVDRDGETDFLVGSSWRVMLHSGATLAPLVDLAPPLIGGITGQAAIVTEALTPGGRRVIVSAGCGCASPASLVFHELALANGSVHASLRFTAARPTPLFSMDCSLVDLGDIDGDGFADVAVSAHGPIVNGPRAKSGHSPLVGLVTIHSTRDGSTLRTLRLEEPRGDFGNGMSLSTGAAWGKNPLLLVTCGRNVESSAAPPLLCAFALDTGELVQRIELQPKSFGEVMNLVVLRDREQHERIVVGCADLDPSGYAGHLLVSPLDSHELQIGSSRADWIR